MIRAALLGVLLAAAAHAAQTGPVSVTGRVGIAGAVRSAKLAPVVIDVDSQTASGPAFVRYQHHDDVWQRALELSPGTRKRCVLLADEFGRDATVAVVDPAGNVLARSDAWYPDQLPEVSLYTVVVARPEQQHPPAGLHGLSVERASGREAMRVDVRFVRAADLPEHWAAWSAADCVVIGDDDLERATPGGLDAILDWTTRGGTLIVSGGTRPGRLAGTPLAGVLPVALSGKTVSLSALDALDAAFPGGTLASTGGGGLPLAVSEGIKVREPFLVPAAQVRAGALELVTEAGPEGPVPLVATKRLGDGHVVYLAVDLERSPFAYTGRVAHARMWRAMLPRPARGYEHRYDSRMSTRASDLGHGRMRLDPAEIALTAEPPTRRTPWLVGGFVVLYWVLVGPVQYVVLRRKRALHLVWVVTPTLALAFSLAAFGLGYVRRGSATISRELMVVFGRAGDPRGAADALVRVHAFKELGYTVRGIGPALGLPLAVENGEAIPVATFGPDVAAVDASVPMWSERTFWVAQPAALPVVTADLQVTTDQAGYLGPGKRVRGTVTSDRAMKQVRLQLGGFHASVGDLSAGQPREVDVRLVNKTAEPDDRPWVRGRRRRPTLERLAVEEGWWGEYGSVGPVDRLDLIGQAEAALFEPPDIVPAVGARQRAVVCAVAVPYRLDGQHERMLPHGYTHRRTRTDADLSLGQLAVSAPLELEAQLAALPRPRFRPLELTLLLGRHDKLPANLYLKHPVHGRWDQIYKAGTVLPSSSWRDGMMRLDIPAGAEYVRMPRALVDVKIEPVGGPSQAGAFARLDFEVRGFDADPEVFP